MACPWTVLLRTLASLLRDRCSTFLMGCLNIHLIYDKIVCHHWKYLCEGMAIWKSKEKGFLTKWNLSEAICITLQDLKTSSFKMEHPPWLLFTMEFYTFYPLKHQIKLYFTKKVIMLLLVWWNSFSEEFSSRARNKLMKTRRVSA